VVDVKYVEMRLILQNSQLTWKNNRVCQCFLGSSIRYMKLLLRSGKKNRHFLCPNAFLVVLNGHIAGSVKVSCCMLRASQLKLTYLS
jgi:hypothetical protein